MPHKFKIVDHFQRMREPYFAHVQVCDFLVCQEAGFITYLLVIRFTLFLPINLEFSLKKSIAFDRVFDRVLGKRETSLLKARARNSRAD